MEKFDLSNLSYKELCKLEEEILEKKMNFMRIGDCYVFNDQDGVPHLCFQSDKYRENYCSMKYYFIFYDVFTKEEIAKIGEYQISYKNKFYYYLDRANMRYHCESYDYDYCSQCFKHYGISYIRFKGKSYYDNELYSLDTIATLWETVKNLMLNDQIDKGNEKRKELKLT